MRRTRREVLQVEVHSPGLLTTVQDARGRLGFERFGVPTSGALDWLAAEAANRLVGNAPDAAVLEMTLVGPTLRISGGPTVVAVTGADLSPVLGSQPLGVGWSWYARSGDLLSFGERRRGARAYLAVAGGFQADSVLGSPSADLRSGFAGLAGRALRAGDRVRVLEVPDVAARAGAYLDAGVPDSEALVRIVAGPHLDHFAAGALEQLCGATWQIDAQQADRMGYRLVGPRLRHTHGADVASLGLPVGAIQVTGNGQPIVLLADHQPTGGYTVLACVIRADLPLLAQRAPGEAVRFRRVTFEEARAALSQRRAALQRVDAEATTWAGLRLAGSGAVSGRRRRRRAGQ